MASRSFWILLIVALALGAAIMWIDTRPSWDDTGVTAGLIFVATAAMGFLSPTRAWLLALAVASWVPAFGLSHGNAATALAFAFGFGGAYAGAAARCLIAFMAR